MNSNLVTAIRGPILLMLVGTLFALDHFTAYSIWRTWPVLLIAAGILALWSRFAAVAKAPHRPISSPPYDAASSFPRAASVTPPVESAARPPVSSGGVE
jgi:hypothetical protein